MMVVMNPRIHNALFTLAPARVLDSAYWTSVANTTPIIVEFMANNVAPQPLPITTQLSAQFPPEPTPLPMPPIPFGSPSQMPANPYAWAPSPPKNSVLSPPTLSPMGSQTGHGVASSAAPLPLLPMMPTQAEMTNLNMMQLMDSVKTSLEVLSLLDI